MADVDGKPPATKRPKPLPTPLERQEADALQAALFGNDNELEGFGQEEGTSLSIADLVRGATDDRGRKAGAKGGAKAAAAAAAAPAPAWHDPADAEVQVDVVKKSRNRKLRRDEEETELDGELYAQRLREEHQRLHPRTEWAELPAARRARRRQERAAARGGSGGDGSESEEEEWESDLEDDEPGAIPAVRMAGGLLLGKTVGGKLPAADLEVTRLRDANSVEPSGAVVRSVQFHPNAQLFLTAGLDKSLRLFQVDGARNPKVQSVFLEDLPIHQASFSGDGQQVICAGRRKHFYVYDLPAGRVERVHGIIGREERSCETFAVTPAHAPTPLLAFLGNEGHIPLVSLKSRQAVGTLKMNGAVRCAAFSGDGTQLYSSGSDGTVYLWDLRTQRCVSRNTDEGCINSTALACSADGGWVATGADTGVVNIYQRSSLVQPPASKYLPNNPKPYKTLLNLTTTVDNLAFNPDAQVLAISSRMKKDALRLVHLPTGKVFANWPTSRTPLHCVTAMAFSPGGGYFAIGNAKGKALLYRVHHYKRA